MKLYLINEKNNGSDIIGDSGNVKHKNFRDGEVIFSTMSGQTCYEYGESFLIDMIEDIMLDYEMIL